METRVAVLGIIVEDAQSIDDLNAILHQYAHCIVGRMGIPYRKRDINIISVAMEASQQDISALSGKIGRLSGITCKTAYSGLTYKGDANE